MAFKYKGLRLKDPSLMKRLRRVPNIKFTRASVAYDKYGNSVPVDTPRFGIAGGPNDGVLIEEAHTNLLTADVSQALTTESPYTTGTLDGTYTFSCMTGSYELSGGATGTVTPTSPQTKTITSATVTLTGDATYNQITATAYPLSWTLGGTTMAAESLTAPSSVLNIDTEGTGEMTFESEILIRDIATTKNIIYFRAEPGKNSCTTDITTSATRNVIYDATGKYKLRQHSSTPNLNTFCKIASTHKEGELNIFQNGIKSEESYMGDGGTGILTASPRRLYLGGHASGAQKINGLLRNVVLTKQDRVDGDITNRSYRDGFGVDKEVTLIAPLKNNLNAYRVATV